MKRTLLFFFAVSAAVAFADQRVPFAVGSLDLSRDTDGFRSEIYTIGGGEYLSDNRIDRIGYRHSEGHYSADDFSAHNNVDSLFGNVRVNDATQADLGIEVARAHLDNGENRWLGSWQLSGQPTKLSNVELHYEKNWIDSRNGLSDGVTYAAMTFAADYQFTDRFNLAGVIGRFNYSDDNARPLYRAKATYVISETYGINMYLRGRKYSDTHPYTGNYFSPDHYRDWLAGFGIRRRLPFVRGTVSGTVDWGRQIADDAAAPARTWQIRLESWVGQRFTYALSTGFNQTAGVGGGTDYEYRFTSASASWRF